MTETPQIPEPDDEPGDVEGYLPMPEMGTMVEQLPMDVDPPPDGDDREAANQRPPAEEI